MKYSTPKNNVKVIVKDFSKYGSCLIIDVNY